MKKMNLKKLFCGIISTSMLLSALPVTMATAALDTNDVTVIYENTYEDDTKVKARQIGSNAVYTSVDDVANASNKVLMVENKAGTTDAKVLFTDNSLWDETDTYVKRGASEDKALVWSIDFYIDNDIIPVMEALEKTSERGQFIAMTPQVGTAPGNSDGYNYRPMDGNYGLRLSEGKLLYGDRWSSTKEITTDAWHNLGFVYNPETKATDVYVDNVKIDTRTFYRSVNYNHAVFGMSINSENLSIPTSMMYFDNASIYQVNKGFNSEFAFDEEAKKATLTFTTPVSADMASKITVANASNYTVTIADKVATIDFSNSNLAANTTYTVSTAGLTDEYYQTLAVNEYSFTTEPDALNWLYDEDYEGEYALWQRGGTSEIATDPTDENNKVLKLYNSTGTTVSGNNAAIYAVLQQNSIKDAWSDIDFVTYDKAGAIEGRSLVYEMKFYMSEALANQLDGGWIACLFMGPEFAADGTAGYLEKFASKMGFHRFVYEDKTYYKYNESQMSGYNYDNLINSWIDMKWVVEGTGDSTTIKTYFNDELVATETAVNKYNYSSTNFKGLSIYTKKIFTESLYVDDVKIYQISKDFEGEFEFDQLAEEGTITLTQKITEADLANIVIKDASGNTVAANKSLSDNGKVVTFSFNDKLVSSATYTVDASALKDAYGQTLVNGTFTFVTAKNPIRTLYSENYEGTFNVLKTYGTVTNSKSVTMADKDGNADNSVVSIWSTGTINNDDKHYLSAFLTNQTDVWGGAKTYSAYSDFVNGRPVIYEADVYVTEDFTAAVPSHWSKATPLGPVFTSGNATLKAEVKTHFIREGQSALLYGGEQGSRKTFTENTWHSLKWVLEPANDGTTAANLTYYLDDTKIKTESVTFNPETAKMYGIHIGRMSDGAAIPEDSLFVDNVKIWQAESAFGLNNAIYDPNEGAVLVKTGTRPVQTAIDAITLKLGDTDVTSLITSRVWDDANSTLKLYVPFANLQVAAEYTVTMPANSSDIIGQIITEAQSVTFKTPKSKSIAITNTVVTVPTASGASVDVTLENGAANYGEAWVVMAVYGEYNELLAVYPETVGIDGSNSKTVTLASESDCTGAVEMRVYVWDNPEDMNPLQKNELVWSSTVLE